MLNKLKKFNESVGFGVIPVGIVLIVIFLFNFSRIHSFDIFWQLQSGKYIWQTKSFIYTDIFSLASDVFRYEHCWLHDIVMYAAYSAVGYSGISFVKAFLMFLTALFLVMAAKKRGGTWLTILVFLGPAVALTRGGWLERPQLWTFLLCAVFIWLFEDYRSKPSRRIFLVVPLMLAWANLHAGAVLAYPLFAAYLVGNAGDIILKRLDHSWKQWRVLLIALAGLVVVTYITPYGSITFDTLMNASSLGGEVVETKTAESGTVKGAKGGSVTKKRTGPVTQLFNMDWRPTTFERDPGFYYAMGVAIFVAVLGFGRLTVADLVLMVGLAFMGMKLGRHTAFFLFACAAILPPYLDDFFQTIGRFIPSKAHIFFKGGGYLLAIAFTCWLLFPVYKLYGFGDPGLREWHYPIEATEFIEENNLPKNIYNTYDWGGYLMWKLYPKYLVFWDGRSDSVEMFEKGLHVMQGKEGWRKILDDYDVNTIVSKGATVNSGRRYPILDHLMVAKDWALVFSDESSVVLVRRGSVEANWLAKNELPKYKIEDMILSEAQLLVSTERSRYFAYWEVARILMKRKQYRVAISWLEAYLYFRPNDRTARQSYQFAKSMIQKQ